MKLKKRIKKMIKSANKQMIASTSVSDAVALLQGTPYSELEGEDRLAYSEKAEETTTSLAQTEAQRTVVILEIIDELRKKVSSLEEQSGYYENFILAYAEEHGITCKPGSVKDVVKKIKKGGKD